MPIMAAQIVARPTKERIVMNACNYHVRSAEHWTIRLMKWVIITFFSYLNAQTFCQYFWAKHWLQVLMNSRAFKCSDCQRKGLLKCINGDASSKNSNEAKKWFVIVWQIYRSIRMESKFISLFISIKSDDRAIGNEFESCVLFSTY